MARKSRKTTSVTWRTGKPNATRTDEIPFVLSRILLQDLTGTRPSPTSPRCAVSPPV